jgi:hypothetical protein
VAHGFHGTIIIIISCVIITDILSGIGIKVTTTQSIVCINASVAFLIAWDIGLSIVGVMVVLTIV